jgi:hypothetical protein
MHDRLTWERSGMRASGIRTKHRIMNREVLVVIGALASCQACQDETTKNGVPVGEHGPAAKKRQLGMSRKTPPWGGTR